MEAQYQSEYDEIQCIGRGNFGAAYLVKNKAENKEYIAKKILLGTMIKNEQDSAMMEVNLLRALKHPNIVDYKTSFISQGMLIIVMEYCEVGDLSFHIKRKLQKNEHFTETEIFNWFVQLCLSLEYIHGRKVLHRDLKSQNIFLTGNNTVKLGDFGISKVLENTNGAAMTVVGTPYYMSPEVCQNHPYTFKSDVWALGCVLYELCTLKHAFSADNLLGLVYKIVQDKYDPIPAHYSQDLQNLISMLLNKNAQERPSVAQVLQMPIVRQKMQDFVASGGSTLEASKPVYVRNAPLVVQAQVQIQGGQDPYAGLTPKERIARRKEEEIKRKQEELSAHTKNAVNNYQFSKQMQYNQLHSSIKGTQRFDQTVIHNKPAATGQFEQTAFHNPVQQQQPSLQASQKFDANDRFEGTEFSVNDRTLEFSQSLGTQMSGMSLNDSPNKFNSPSTQSSFNPNPSSYEDRVLSGSGNYDLTMASNEFDIEEDLEEVVEAKEDKQQLKEVVKNYLRILSGVIEEPEEELVLQSRMSQETALKQEAKQTLVGNKKQYIMNGLGQDVYQRMYEFLKFNRRKGTNEEDLYRNIRQMLNNDRRMLTLVFELDGLVFMELQNEM
eukprot:403361812